MPNLYSTGSFWHRFASFAAIAISVNGGHLSINQTPATLLVGLAAILGLRFFRPKAPGAWRSSLRHARVKPNVRSVLQAGGLIERIGKR